MFRHAMLALLLSACAIEVTNEGDEAAEGCAACAADEDTARAALELPAAPPAPERMPAALGAADTTCVEGATCAPWPGFAGWTYVCAIGQAPPSPTCAAVEPGVFCCP
jgi:hypothetical protein